MSESASVAFPISRTELGAVRRRAILSCAIGNFFELFDFTIYGFFAVPISRAFFPAGDPVLSMVSTFAAFGVAFIMRPVGAVVLGNYGDRAGRRAALVVTIGLMATATGATGLIPTYGSIGIWAPAMLLICRMVQGFSTGGEWGGAATQGNRTSNFLDRRIGACPIRTRWTLQAAYCNRLRGPGWTSLLPVLRA